jgi:hypothetical protein
METPADIARPDPVDDGTKADAVDELDIELGNSGLEVNELRVENKGLNPPDTTVDATVC